MNSKYIPKHRKLETAAIRPDPFYDSFPLSRYFLDKIKDRLDNLSDRDIEYMKVRFANDKERLVRYLMFYKGFPITLTTSDLIAFPFLDDIDCGHYFDETDLEDYDDDFLKD